MRYRVVRVSPPMMPRPVAVSVVAGAFLGTAGCDRPEAAREYVPKPPGTVTYSKDIAPILADECATCHRPGEMAPFSLVSYDDVKPMAPLIASVTQQRLMPPWLPKPIGRRYAGERRLSTEEIGLIQQWADDGAPRGARDAVRFDTSSGGWSQGQPDLIITMPVPFTLHADGPELFRNFVIPIPVTATRYVRAVELRPGNRRIVHHAMMMIDTSESSRRMDERDPAPGFDGMSPRTKAEIPLGFFLGWTPGKLPDAGDDGMAWRLQPGTDFVLQLHLRPTGDRETIQSAVGFYYADAPPTRFPSSIKLSSQVIDIPAGESDYHIRDSYRLPVDVEVLGVYPHAHYLATEMRGFATLPDGSVEHLLHIERWDFNWQDSYEFVQPVFLPKGTVLEMVYTYDNSAQNPLNPNTPPTRVVYGPASTDEMGDLWIRVLPRDTVDRRILFQDFALKNLRTEITGLQKMLRDDPEDERAHYNLGNAFLSLGRRDDAIAHYRRALAIDSQNAEAHYNIGVAYQGLRNFELAAQHYRQSVRRQPTNGSAHYNLGIVLEALGRDDEATTEYRQVLEVDPGHANAHNNLGTLLQRAGNPTEAEAHYRAALKLNADHVDANNNLGNLLRSQRRVDEAIRHYRAALRADPEHALAHFNLGATLVMTDQGRAAVEHLEEAARLAPEWPPPVTTLAWTLATHPDRKVRDAERALLFAERAAELTQYRHPTVLDALAAAHAANGNYERAVVIASEAASLARESDAPALADDIRKRVVLYQRGQPYRERR